MTAIVTSTGGLGTNCDHVRSGNSFMRDALLDNHGLGQACFPNDTVVTGLASCVFSVMGIMARGLELDLEKSTAEVIKHMETDSRRISRIDVTFNMPKKNSDKHRIILEHTARTCPVHLSLHPDIIRNITFQWDL